MPLSSAGTQFGGAVPLQKPDQGSRDGAEGIAAFGGLMEQCMADRRCAAEKPVACSMMAGGALVFDQRLDMGGGLDLFSHVVAAGMSGDGLAAVCDADLVVIRQHGQWPADMGVGDRVVVEIEADIGRLPGHDLLTPEDARRHGRLCVVALGKGSGRGLGKFGFGNLRYVFLRKNRRIRRFLVHLGDFCVRRLGNYLGFSPLARIEDG